MAVFSAPLLWLLLGLGLLLLEGLGVEFDGLLAAAVAALGLSAATALVPLGAVVQGLAFAALTAVLVVGLQRWSRSRERAIPLARGAELAAVISGFQGHHGDGRVRWQGQSWAAVNLEPEQPLQAGDPVVVMGRDGNQLQVLPSRSGRPQAQ